MSINVCATNDTMYNDLKSSLIEIIQDELNEVFLDWFCDLDGAIYRHFCDY